MDIRTVDSDSDSDSVQKPLIQLSNVRGMRGWINKAERTIPIDQNPGGDPLRSPSVVSIFRVPNFLKDLKKEGYVPKIVSLGPYHHRSEQLRLMDDNKGKALCRMMRRFNIILNNDINNTVFCSRAKVQLLQLADEIQKNYEEKIDCKAEDLALMLSLDGCFILEILRTMGGDTLPVAEACNCYEPIFDRNKIEFTGFDILNDILMLENQIPLIVLGKLLELELKSVESAKKKLFEVLVQNTGGKFYPFNYEMQKWSWPQPEEQVHHLLGLLHTLIVSPPSGRGEDTNQDQYPNGPHIAELNDVRRILRAVELRNAGIKFKSSDGGIMKIKFNEKNATICLPPINVTHHTEVLFRNLIALELCKASRINFVSCYLSLMDELIDLEEDVALLRRSGIITNYLGSDAEVAKLFNGLCKGVTVSREDHFKQLKRNVIAHYRKKTKVWLAELMKEYFSSPWRSLALAGAITLLLLTVVQTIFSVLSYIRCPST